MWEVIIMRIMQQHELKRFYIDLFNWRDSLKLRRVIKSKAKNIKADKYITVRYINKKHQNKYPSFLLNSLIFLLTFEFYLNLRKSMMLSFLTSYFIFIFPCRSTIFVDLSTSYFIFSFSSFLLFSNSFVIKWLWSSL